MTLGAIGQGGSLHGWSGAYLTQVRGHSMWACEGHAAFSTGPQFRKTCFPVTCVCQFDVWHIVIYMIPA